MHAVALVALGVGLTVPGAAAPERDFGWAHLSAAPALAGSETRIDIGGAYDDKTPYIFRRVEVARTGERTIRWFDSGTCPAASEVPRRLAALKLPAGDVPGQGEPSGIAFGLDGVTYRLVTYARAAQGGGEVTWVSNLDSPLQQLVDFTTKILASCPVGAPPTSAETPYSR